MSRAGFFCELCNKGYARVQEYDAHCDSYDHHHRKRRKDLQELSRPSRSTATDKDELTRLREPDAISAPKKGFKSAFGTQRADAQHDTYRPESPTTGWTDEET